MNKMLYYVCCGPLLTLKINIDGCKLTNMKNNCNFINNEYKKNDVLVNSKRDFKFYTLI